MSRRLFDLFCGSCGHEEIDRWEEYQEIKDGKVPCPSCEQPLDIKMPTLKFDFANGWTATGEPKYIEAVYPGSDKVHKLPFEGGNKKGRLTNDD